MPAAIKGTGVRMALKCSSASTDYGYYRVHTIEQALKDMETGKLPFSQEYTDVLLKQRAAELAKIGYKTPKVNIDLMPTVFVSPESLKVTLDPEYGYVVVARTDKKASPIYHVVTVEVAGMVMRHEITPELKQWLITPDEYLGE